MDNEIQITPEAVAATLQYRRENSSYSNLPLRVYLSGKGCDGFDYGVTFDQQEEQDLVFKFDSNIDLVCDPRTFEFVKGSTIDWVDDERGRGFLILNPHHKKYRGKFYRKKSWQERFNGTTSQ